MTKEAIISATTSADTSVTGTIRSGESVTFGTTGLESDKGEYVRFEKPNGAGSSYSQLYVEGADGRTKEAKLTTYKTTVKLTGPLEYRINKTATAASVEVTKYS